MTALDTGLTTAQIQIADMNATSGQGLVLEDPTIVSIAERVGKTAALDGLDLSVATGEVHGFLGPNGSGKTTTIRILLGLLRSDGGTARLLGQTTGAALVALFLARSPADGTQYSLLTGAGFALLGAVLSMLRLSAAGNRGAERVAVQEGQRLKGE